MNLITGAGLPLKRVQRALAHTFIVCWRTEVCLLISVTVFNFTHPPVLSALLLTLSAPNRFLVPDFILHHHDRMTSVMPNRDLFFNKAMEYEERPAFNTVSH